MEALKPTPFEITKDIDALRQSVFNWATDGQDDEIQDVLKNCTQEEIHTVLHTPVKYGQSMETTPLIIAARKGYTNVVETLLSKYHVDVEQTGMVEFEGHPVIKGASALWCAASIGDLRMVRMLVEEFKAEVNHATITDSTPLRPACFDGFLEVVEYLVSKGAEVNRPTNYYRNTCLLIASYNGHRKVVKFLLENGAKHEMKDFMGQTALHNAAEKGHLDIAMDLIEHGAQFLPDNKNLTPLHVACDFNHVELVKEFLELPQFSVLDRIHALELLGASYCNGSEDYNIQMAYRYLHEAMILRYQDQENPWVKEVLPPEECYDFQVESSNLEELEKIEHNEDWINTESLILKERILGKYSVHIMDIVYRGAVLAERRDYERCIRLWNRALEIKKYHSESTANDLERYGELFSEMLEDKLQVEPACMRNILDLCVQEIRTDQERLRTRSHDPEIARINDNMKQVIHTACLLISALLDAPDPEDPEFHRTKSLTYKLVRLKPILKQPVDNSSLLHLVCNCSVKFNEYFMQNLVSPPIPRVASILLECGIDANIEDSQGNTPLHVLCMSAGSLLIKLRKERELVWMAVCSELLQYGAHIDQRNHAGKLSIDYVKQPYQQDMLKTQMNGRPLKCLAATVVRSHKLLCDDTLIPQSLVHFVHKH